MAILEIKYILQDFFICASWDVELFKNLHYCGVFIDFQFEIILNFIQIKSMLFTVTILNLNYYL